MTPILISFILGIGAAAWLFNHLQQTSGYNTKRSLTAAGIAGGVVLILSLATLGLLNG